MGKLEHFSDLRGQTLKSIVRNDDEAELIFTLDNGDRYKLYHQQDCCENVYIEDIDGDLARLVGQPILLAEEVSKNGDDDPELKCNDGSCTWTFYKLSTNLDSVTIRWFGTSNGYYSESVNWAYIGKSDDQS